MTDHAELRRLAEAATPGPWSCNRHWAIVGGPTLEFTNGAAQQQIAMACWQSWMHEEELRNNAAFMAAANPKTILALLDEIDGMKASGWRNHSVNYARAEKCPQTLETAQAAWDRDQELIEEQRQQISRDSQMINHLRQKLQSAEVDRDRLKSQNDLMLNAIVKSRTALMVGRPTSKVASQKYTEAFAAIVAALEGATQ
ncbi:ead/Ea22-like family protein [Pseudomonas aeruginosa]|uniref:ead/Ea22-like family protein n=1 Tax=Pseudomonas aeruginosa TaxID=287 RepID=UPI0039084380